MPIEQFPTAKEAIDSIQWRILSAHRGFEGAQVRAALARVNTGISFLTGTMVFFEHEPSSRGTADYGDVLLSEFWIKGVDTALSFVGRLFEGQESVGGIPIRNLFKRSMTHRDQIDLALLNDLHSPVKLAFVGVRNFGRVHRWPTALEP